MGIVGIGTRSLLLTQSLVGMRAQLGDRLIRAPFPGVMGIRQISPGALVTPGKRVPSGQLWAGNPAKHFRDVSDKDRAYFEFSVGHYVELSRKYK